MTDAVTRIERAVEVNGVTDAHRMPGVFGPQAPAPSDAPPHIRLPAFLGRTVSTG